MFKSLANMFRRLFGRRSQAQAQSTSPIVIGPQPASPPALGPIVIGPSVPGQPEPVFPPVPPPPPPTQPLGPIVIGPTPHKAGWAQPSQHLFPKENEGVTWQQQGIVCHVNLMGTPLPVYGCTDDAGLMWRISQSTHIADAIKAGVIAWECEDGRVLPALNQQQAVAKLGKLANYVYNPMVNGRADMGIATPDGWVRMFPDRADF